jgi:hypothetical protein
MSPIECRKVHENKTIMLCPNMIFRQSIKEEGALKTLTDKPLLRTGTQKSVINACI